MVFVDLSGGVVVVVFITSQRIHYKVVFEQGAVVERRSDVALGIRRKLVRGLLVVERERGRGGRGEQLLPSQLSGFIFLVFLARIDGVMHHQHRVHKLAHVHLETRRVLALPRVHVRERTSLLHVLDAVLALDLALLLVESNA